MTSPVHTVTNTWEANRDLLSRKINAWKNKTDNSAISSYTYTVNNLGQRTAVTTAGEAFAQFPADWSWNYDALDQVTQANNDQYAYDQIGNRLTSDKENGAQTAYTANAFNQYAEINSITKSYDADGNLLTGLTSATTRPDRNTQSFTWNANNRPIEIRQNGDVKQLRSYDHLGRRIRKDDTLALYDGYNTIAEYNLSTRALKATYAWGNDLSGSLQGAGGVGGLLSVTEHDKQTRLVSYPCYDGNGNITEYLAEENGGTLAAHYEYDAFGNVTKKAGQREYSYQFSTKPHDVLTGLNYYNYRAYEPVSGRWINRDPIEERGGMNLYLFIRNNPIVYIDLFGFVEVTAQSVAGCLDVKVKIDKSEWKPGQNNPKKIPNITGERVGIHSKWMTDDDCKCIKKEYYEKGYDWVKLKQFQVKREDRGKKSSEDHETDGESPYTGVGGQLEQTIIGTLNDEIVGPNRDKYQGGAPEAVNSARKEAQNWVQNWWSPYQEPNSSFYPLGLPPAGPASSNEYSGVHVQVYVSGKGDTVWILDDYFWFDGGR